MLAAPDIYVREIPHAMMKNGTREAFSTHYRTMNCLGLCKQVPQQETEALGRLGNVLKRDMRDIEIMVSEDTEMTQQG